MSRPAIIKFTVPSFLFSVVAVCVLNVALSAASAQSTPDKEEGTGAKETQQSSAQTETEPDSLDELLGLEDEKRDLAAEEAATRQHLEALKRQLEESPPTDALEMAIEQMDLSADMLDQSFDAGLGTQRLQEEILLRLDVLLDQARKGKCKGGSCSSSGQPKPQPNPNPGKQQPGNPKDKPGGPAADSTPTTGSPRDAELGGELDESQSEWGYLPQRVRDMLLQGRRERFSSLYERLTREYYKRLAEEGS